MQLAHISSQVALSSYNSLVSAGNALEYHGDKNLCTILQKQIQLGNYANLCPDLLLFYLVNFLIRAGLLPRWYKQIYKTIETIGQEKFWIIK